MRPSSLVARSLFTSVALLSLAACGGSTSPSGGTGGDAGAGGAGGGGAGGAGGSGGSVGPAPDDVAGCEGAVFYENPANPGAPGPSPVGAVTTTLGGLTVEVWYPAVRGSEQGVDGKVYDPRQWLPEASQGLIPDADNPYQPCDCRDGLPLDQEHGPYPVVVFVHGTAGFRTQSLSTMVHWASRGFVVVAADHPGLYLGDALSFNLTNDLPADVQTVLDGLAALPPELTFLEGHLDLGRLGLSGHSAGGGAVGGLGSLPGAKVIAPLAAGGVDPGTSVESSLVMGALDDQVVEYANTKEGYASTEPKKRLVGVANAGHLAFSDLCGLQNDKGQDLVEIAQMYDIPNANLASFLWDGCDEGQITQAEASLVTAYATAAALEETLRCQAGDPFATIEPDLASVAEFDAVLQ